MITLKDCLDKYNDYKKDLKNQMNYFKTIDNIFIKPIIQKDLYEEDLIHLLCSFKMVNEKYYKPMKHIKFYDSLYRDFEYHFHKKCNYNYNDYKQHDPTYTSDYNINYFIKHNIFPTNENYDRDILYRIITLNELIKLYKLEFLNETYKNKLMLYQYKHIINIIINDYIDFEDITFVKTYRYNQNNNYNNIYKIYYFIKRFIEEIVDKCNETNKKLAIDHLVKVIYSYISILIEYDIHLLLHNYLCNEYCYVKENFKCIKIILQLLILYYYSKLPKYYLENNIEYINCFYILFINCNEFITYRTDEQNIEYMKELNINLDDCINKFMYKYNKINNQKQNCNTKIDKQIKYNDIETNTENNNTKQDCVIKVETLNITINN